MDRIPDRHPLESKPLVEVIFELRWRLVTKAPGLFVDPGFRIFLGKYYERIKKEYPHVIDLPSARVPEDLTPHTVRHQFWRATDTWPVTQLGPGIVTVNETEGYLWESYRPRLVEAITALYESYPTEIAEFRPEQVTLKYLDAVEFDPKRSSTPLLRFVRENLHTGIDIEPMLFERPDEREAPASLNLNVTYPLSNPSGLVTLMVADGQRNGVPSVIWETSVVSREDLPNSIEGWSTWLDAAHPVMDKWFFALVRGSLLESFERKQDNVELHG